jgi:hypothetical protein
MSSQESLLAVPSPWVELDITVDRPPCRGGHASAFSPDGKFLFVFGGCDPFGVASNALYMISLFQNENNNKSKGQLCSVLDPKQQSVLPPKRSGHCLYALPSSFSSSSAVDSKIVRLILFGGIDYLPTCRIYGDVWIAEVDTSTATILSWKRIDKDEGGKNESQKVVCRHSFASCLCSFDETSWFLFVCGGSNSIEPLSAPMMLKISTSSKNTANNNDNADHDDKKGEILSWIPVLDSNNSFTPVEMVSACFLQNSKIILIAGGRNSEGKDEDSLYSVVPSSSSFVLQRIAKSPSLQRTCASLAPLNNNNNNNSSSAVMIGGVSQDAQLAALPLDVAIDLEIVAPQKEEGTKSSSVVVKMIRPVTRLESTNNNNKNDQIQEIDLVGGVHFGIGQSLASGKKSSDGKSFFACVGGLFPNAVGHTAQIFVSGY